MKYSTLELKKNLMELLKVMSDNNMQTNRVDAKYNKKNNEIILRFEVQGTQYEGRSDRIEELKLNDKVKIVREKENKYNELNLAVSNEKNQSLGNVPSEICGVLSPLIDNSFLDILDSRISYVEPLSKRGSRCKKALLYVELKLKLKNIDYKKGNSSIICLLGGDQTRCWVQKLQVIICDIPFEEAKKLFELHNRFHNEYENTELSYLGLDNLVDEVICSREKRNKEKQENLSYYRDSDVDNFIGYILDMCKKEPNRYLRVKKYVKDYYFDNKFYNLANILLDHAIEEEDYYWIDQCRVSQQEWDRETFEGFNHWYEIAELYNPEDKFPFDLSDEEIVSIFGFNKFEELADLSYGC